MAATAARIEPLAGYKFRVCIGGLDVAEFSECSGLEMTVKFDEVREGGVNEFVHRLPGRIEYGNLVLKRGYARSNELFQWYASVFNRSTIERHDVTLMLIDQHKRPVMEWTFLKAYPVKWSGPSFKAGSNDIAIESVELAHEGLMLR